MSYLWGRFGKDLMQVLASPHLHLKKPGKAADFEAKGFLRRRPTPWRFTLQPELRSPFLGDILPPSDYRQAF